MVLYCIPVLTNLLLPSLDEKDAPRPGYNCRREPVEASLREGCPRNPPKATKLWLAGDYVDTHHNHNSIAKGQARELHLSCHHSLCIEVRYGLVVVMVVSNPNDDASASISGCARKMARAASVPKQVGIGWKFGGAVNFRPLTNLWWLQGCDASKFITYLAILVGL
jgi:hypothetical protein